MNATPDAADPTPPPAPGTGRRSVELTRIGPARFKATNDRGGETFFGTGGEDPDFTPVELLLAAIAGCSALDVEAITHKRTTSTTFTLRAEGDKVRDEQGNHLTGVHVTFDVRFGDGPDAEAARARVPEAIAMSRDRLCTVARTVQLGADVTYDEGDLTDLPDLTGEGGTGVSRS